MSWVCFRTTHSSWYQIPVLYGWWDKSVSGEVEAGELRGAANGHGNGHRVGGVN